MEKIRGFIFDIDGTLLDSNDAHALCIQEGFRRVGYDFKYQTLRDLIGMGMDHIIPKLTGKPAESPEGKLISETKNHCFKKRFSDLDPFHQARELVETLSEKDYELTIATSASKDDLKQYLKKLDIGSFLSEVTSADDADSSKPAPDMIVAALAKLNLRPDEVLMVGDTPYDITAAKKAGVGTIAFRCGGWNDESLKEAVMIFDHAGEMLEKINSGWVPT